MTTHSRPLTRDALAVTTLDPSSEAEQGRREAIPCLTILCHPDLRRVGDRALLPALWRGVEYEVSRLATTFVAPDGSRAAPLADPFVSRRPLMIRRRGSRALEVMDSSGRAKLGFEDGTGTRVQLEPECLLQGIPLVLSDRIILWLHSTHYVESSCVPDIEGGSDTLEAVRRQVAGVAALAHPVLIRGETGVGKELVARGLHRLSPRAAAPFVALNMATLTPGTAPSLLFGHRRGAFTGAGTSHKGVFERAQGGTLFLDEIGATPESIQPMLLRALEQGSVLPLGAERELPVDVRLVTATDAPLEEMERKGQFSAALRHRLSGFDLRVPPLRERVVDIPCLFARFLLRELRELGRPLDEVDLSLSKPPVPAATMLGLMRHPPAGNVRELRNWARRAALCLVAGESIELPSASAARKSSDLQATPSHGPTSGTGLRAARTTDRPRVSRQQLRDALRKHEWSPERAAQELAIPKSTVHHLMRQDPTIRRATDYEDQELIRALEEVGHDVARAAGNLSVSKRALAMTLRQRGLLGRSP